ncbi:hypothetical protein [Wolbachia endosymbiont of Mansonella perstans]|uniref:hypothetical protein n=1 Tax=Wolbachia endosymbiont of Mansonella perstans TaxID=229526 RepID=UPI001CE110D2|nr:hypothetical protein [Wolbachia endosymbiont of Mansonella perstans]
MWEEIGVSLEFSLLCWVIFFSTMYRTPNILVSADNVAVKRRMIICYIPLLEKIGTLLSKRGQSKMGRIKF